jgi:hypothetical protein
MTYGYDPYYQEIQNPHYYRSTQFEGNPYLPIPGANQVYDETGYIRDPKTDAIRQSIADQRSAMWKLAGLAIVTYGASLILTPIFHIPKAANFLLLATSTISAGAFSYVSYLQQTQEETHSKLRRADQISLAKKLAHNQAFNDAVDMISAEDNLAGYISTLPEYKQPRYLEKFQLHGLLELPYQQPALEAAPGGGMPEQNYLTSFDEVAAYQAELARPKDAYELYAKCAKEHCVFAANSQEGKTVAAHYALYQWATAEPNLVLYVFDSHYGNGSTPEFRSNWLGIPLMQSVPKAVQSGIFKGDAKDLNQFLLRVRELFEYRKKNNINYPPVVVGVDEFTNQLEELDDDEREEVNKTLNKLATEAKKFGIYFWLMMHTLTLEEMGIKRKALRQAHIIMGAEMTQDKIQMKLSPRTIPDSAAEYAQSIYRQVGRPAGFATSLPVDMGYLPTPPINGLEELRLNWVPGSNWTGSIIPGTPAAPATPAKSASAPPDSPPPAASQMTVEVPAQQVPQAPPPPPPPKPVANTSPEFTQQEIEDFWFTPTAPPTPPRSNNQSINAPQPQASNQPSGSDPYAPFLKGAKGDPYKALSLWLQAQHDIGSTPKIEEIQKAYQGFSGLEVSVKDMEFLLKNLPAMLKA